MDVRQLTNRDAQTFRALRIAALIDSPSAFGSSVEEVAGLPLSAFEQRLTGGGNNAHFGSSMSGVLVGCVRVTRAGGAKERHRASIGSMFVARQARRRGLATLLLDAAIRHAGHWGGVVQVELAVTATNEPAVALYRRSGFVEYGRVPRALLVEGTYHDEILMVLKL